MTSSLETVSVARPAPELLAPAGDWECARAAVENGADGIYFGLERFNARMRAHNFTAADLPELMAFLHRRGVKGYVTFNTLVFSDEMAEAVDFLRAIISAGVDAAIVQDVGVARLIRSLSPDFPMHASTQMTVTSAAGVEFVRELGCERVILARECPIKEIQLIHQALAAAAAARPPDAFPIPQLEAFVHGALCVAYSGQCLTSEALGGRSANRGECAQACRLPYELIADGQPVPLGDRRYLLSPQDLAGLEVLPDLLRAGVSSVKIEGRLKSPEYVASITRVYRQAIDECGRRKAEGGISECGVRNAECGISECGVRSAEGGEKTADARALIPHSAFRIPHYEMEMAFSRGLSTGWYQGINNQKLVHARFGKKRGVYLGEIKRVEGERVVLRLEAPLKPGDGVVFDAGHPDQDEEGGRVYEVRNAECGVRNREEGIRSAERGMRNEERGKSAAQSKDARQGRVRSADLRIGAKREDELKRAESEFGAPPAGEVVLAFGRGDVNFSRVHAGDKLWKTSDPELDRRVRQTFAGDQLRFQRPLRLEVRGAAGGPMTLIAQDEAGHVVEVTSAMPLAAAEKQPLTTERLRDQLGRLGGTPFRLGELKSLLEGEVILPISELNRLRRDAVGKLEELRAQPKKWKLECGVRNAECGISERGMRNAECGIKTSADAAAIPHSALRTPHSIELLVLVRNFAQFDAALEAGVTTLYCEFEDPKKYREAVDRFRVWQLRQALVTDPAPAAGSPSSILHPPSSILHPPSSLPPSSLPPRPSSAIFAVPPRITKMGEEWILKQVRSSNADGYLIRNYDHLQYFTGCRRIGDFSLNVANPMAAEYFIRRHKLERVTASYDLNAAQLESLLRSAPPEWFEITIHQHMPMFHMEHCVFCAFLSNGTDYTNCGRPCDKHAVELRDRVGAAHPVKADAGCRNTVFNALAQTGAEHAAQLVALGARHFRIEFLNESADTVARTLRMYRQLLAGEITGHQLWRELKLVNRLGVTRGSQERAEARLPKWGEIEW